MKYLILIILFCASPGLFGQVIIDADHEMKKLDSIQLNHTLPEGLLKGKSIVVHAYPEAAKNFKKAADNLQAGLQKAGIDAVAHFLFQDIFSGTEVVKAYREQFAEREIDFIIYYSADSIHQLRIMPYAETFFEGTAFSISHPELEKLLHTLYLQAARSELEKLNLLILNKAAFGEVPEIIERKRNEFYDLNMKSGKVAIQKTPDSLLNKEIDSVMASYYPYKFDLVDPHLTAEELRQKGYWFLLYGVSGMGKTVKKLLEYETVPDETAYASIVANNNETQVKTIDINIPVYKFYIKHTNTGDVFLGKHYDADERWEVALKNYILNLRNILGD